MAEIHIRLVLVNGMIGKMRAKWLMVKGAALTGGGLDLSKALITQETLGLYREPGLKPIDKYQALIADKYTLTVDVAIGDAEMNEMKRMINNSDKLRGLKLYKEQKSINLLTP